MASNSARGVCPICLEVSTEISMVGMCRHGFCRKCLVKHLHKQSPNTTVFPCPTCGADCMQFQTFPGDMAMNLLFQSSDGSRNPSLSGESVHGPVKLKPGDHGTPPSKQIDGKLRTTKTCRICCYKSLEVEAVSVCEECDGIYLCKDCTRIHNKNLATRDHVIMPLTTTKTTEAKCEMHNETLKDFCCTCDRLVCKVCILLEHGDHMVKKIREVVRSKVEEVEAAIEERERKIKDVNQVYHDLKSLTTKADQDRGALIQVIEDHAERCIKKIQEDKASLKKQVESAFHVPVHVQTGLQELPEMVRKSLEGVTQGKQLLADQALLQPADFQKIHAAHQDLVQSAQLVESVDLDSYWKPFRTIYQSIPRFVSEQQTEAINIGKLHARQTNTNPKLLWENKKGDRQQAWNDVPIQVQLQNRKQKLRARFHHHEQSPHQQDTSMNIPSLAILDEEYFAMANPMTSPNAVDIYKFPGEFMRTLNEHVSPLYNMCGTRERKLAVLSQGNTPIVHAIKIFDPRNGYVKSTSDFSVKNPLSMCVTVCNEYLILGDGDEGLKRITLVSKEGVVITTFKIDITIDGLVNPSRIACGGRYTYIMGETSVALYELKHGKDETCTSATGSVNDLQGAVDISATLSGELFLIQNKCTRQQMQPGFGIIITAPPYLSKIIEIDTEGCISKASFQYNLGQSHGNNMLHGQGGGYQLHETRLAVKGNTIVISNARGFRVYQF